LSNQLNLRCCCLLKNKVKANLMNISIEHLLAILKQSTNNLES
jgi:hypothetical protein